MGCKRLSYQEKNQETGKLAFQLRLYDSRINRWLTPDPYGQYASPYLGMGNDPVYRIDPDGGFSPPTDYIDEQGNLLLRTNDGSNDIITVSNEMLGAFLENVSWTGNNLLDSEGWNYYWKSTFLGGADNLNRLDQFTTQWSRQNAIILYNIHL